MSRAPSWSIVLLGGAGTAFLACSAVLGIEDTTDEPVSTVDGSAGGGDDAPAGEDVEDASTPATDGGDPGSEPTPVDAGVDADAAPPCDLSRPFNPPVAAGPTINTGAYETAGRLSTDELTLWFARRSTATSTDTDIYVAIRPDKGTAFGAASKVSELNSAEADGYLTTPAGDLLGFFISLRSGGGDIYRAKRALPTAAWGSVVKAPAVNTGSLEDDVFILSDARALYFDAKRTASNDIYRAAVDGNGNPSAAVPVNGLNTSAEESEPVVTLDERTIYFARVGASGRKIQVAKRASAVASWGTPVGVSELNSTNDESPTWVSPDGCRIVISSERPGAGRRDIYLAEKPK